MKKAVEAMAGLWWRFDRYEIRNGYVRPARRARLSRYNLWEVDRKRSPVIELVELSRSLKEASERSGPGFYRTLPEEWQQRVCEWCQKFGLLGLLPEALLWVALPPRWAREPPLFRRGGAGYFIPSQTLYLETPTGWSSSTVFRDALRRRKVDRSSSRLLHEKTARKLGLRPEVALNHSGKISWATLETGLGQFFPSVPTEQRSNFRCPLPLSPEFWRTYAEPLPLFLQRASKLRLIYEDLGGAQPTERELARSALNELISKVHPTTYWEGRQLQMEWVSTSLGSTLAMMLAQEHLGGFRFLFCACAGCGRAFVSDRYQAKYCSKPCRWRDQKRRETVVGD